jgi:hypothetical protein
MESENISYLELLAVRMALTAFIGQIQTLGRVVRLWVDNNSALYAILNGKSTSSQMMEELRQLYKFVTENQIELRPFYIPSAANPADFWSRRGREERNDWKLAPALFRHLQTSLQASSELDLFATSRNKQLPLFCAEHAQADPGYKGDAWDFDWKQKRLWANPPFNMVQKVLDTIIQRSPKEIVLVLPLWSSATWMHDALLRASRVTFFHSSPLAFLPGKLGSVEPLGNCRWRFCAVKILNGGHALPALGHWGSKLEKQQFRLTRLMRESEQAEWLTEEEIRAIIQRDL